MFPYTEDNMPLKWIFLQDNNPKHTNQTAKPWFRENEIEVMDLPNLNPIDIVWAGIEEAVYRSQTKSCWIMESNSSIVVYSIIRTLLTASQ
ncbi:putative sagittal suture morphogenesis [Trypoxylus dichotomus]